MFPPLLEKPQRHDDLTADEAAVRDDRHHGGQRRRRRSPACWSRWDEGRAAAEIVGFARAMRGAAVRLTGDERRVRHVRHRRRRRRHVQHLVGGAVVVAGGRRPVAKHGNRSVSSRAGARTCSGPRRRRVGLAGHGRRGASTERASRSSSRRRSTPRCATPPGRAATSACGPLRPARARSRTRRARGPAGRGAAARAHRTGGAALARLGSERAWVVHGADGLDEISTGATRRFRVPRRVSPDVLRASG